MSTEAIVLDALTHDLTAYLKKLGLDVDRQDGHALICARRTSLNHEEVRFKVVARPPARESRSWRYIVPDSYSDRVDDREDTDRFSEFLDSTIQADLLCRQILDDRDVQRDREIFVPQHIDVNGEPQAVDAPQYVGQWLSGTQGGLLVVLAPAGYGKTVLTRVIASRLAEAHMNDTGRPREPFPFLIPFGDFRRVSSFESMIVQALHRHGVTDVMAGAFSHLVQRRRCVLLLDGFDELLEERPDEARKNLRELLETLGPESRVMVTARSTFFRTSTDVSDFLEHGISADDVTIVDLRPFDAQQRRTLVQKLTTEQRTITYINQILEVDGVSEAMGSPLLLRETIEALRDPLIRSQLSTETKRSGLFRVLEASVYERERQRHGHKFPDRVQARFVEMAAEEMLRANARGFDRDSIDVLALEAAECFDFEAPAEDFAQLSDHHFFVVDHADEVVRFNHQVFREYFQAKSLLTGSNANEGWVRSVLYERPLPEEVAEFLSEVADGDAAFETICSGCGRVSAGGFLARNLTLLCQAVGTRRAVESLLATLDDSVMLDLRLVDLELVGFDFGLRVFERLELLGCDLTGADLSQTLIRELHLAGTTLDGARLSPGSPEVLQLGYSSREFEPVRIQQELRAIGVAGLEANESTADTSRHDWRSQVEALLSARLRRFLTSVEGNAYLWDKSILERNLFGGLGQVDRLFVRQDLLPEMLRRGVLTKHREHNNVVFRLSDDCRDDARALLEGTAQGSIAEVLDALAPRGQPSR